MDTNNILFKKISFPSILKGGVRGGFLFLQFIVYSLLITVPARAQVVGSIPNPLPRYNSYGTEGQGLFVFLSNILKLTGTIAGIYMIIQLIIAGYAYIAANGDPKKVEAAWGTIWQSIVGMVIIASAFTIATVVERFTGIKILNPTIYGPTTP